MLKIGVIGAGHLGKIHIKVILELKDEYELVGFFDSNEENRKTISEEFGCKAFDSMDDLITSVDVVDIVTPTLSHFDCASAAIKACKHVFIEKPVTETLEEAKTLINLSEEADIKAQVGHVERFNPAFLAAKDVLNQPLFIESHRLAQFNPRGTDVPVVLDLMIHDIDIVLSIVKSNIKRVSASGVAIISETPDIANVRLEFDNGAVANLTASRISLKNMRKSRIFQKDAYVSIDFLQKELDVVKIDNVEGEPDPFDFVLDTGKNGIKKKISIEKPEIGEVNAIKEELRSLANSINNNTQTEVTLDDGFKALEVAQTILEQLKYSGNLLKENI